MIEEIMILLKSNNIQDRVLGLIIASEKDLLKEIFWEKAKYTPYKRELNFLPILEEESKLVILKGELFWISYNHFIGWVKDTEKEGFINRNPEDIIYNDGSYDRKD